MFCPNCGAQIQDQSIFCVHCGRPVLSSPALINPAECVGNLRQILPDLRSLEENYKQIGRYSQASDAAGKDMKLFVGGICLFLGYVVAALFEKMGIASLIGLVVGIAAGFVLYLSCGGFLRQVMNTERRSYEAQKAEYVEKYQQCYLVAPVLERYLPEDYWYSDAVEAVSAYLRNMRADSIKEALNLYEEELHRLRMENTAQLILIENKKQTAYAALQLLSLATINLQLS